MTLQVQTARVTYVGPDRLDVTRKTGGPEGTPFAPSWAILEPALAARRRVIGMVARSRDVAAAGGDESELIERAQRIDREAWEVYVPAYLEEMRASYRSRRPAWDALLARERVTALCYCTDPLRCHRRLLAGILVKLGAVDLGELEPAAQARRAAP